MRMAASVSPRTSIHLHLVDSIAGQAPDCRNSGQRRLSTLFKLRSVPLSPENVRHWHGHGTSAQQVRAPEGFVCSANLEALHANPIGALAVQRWLWTGFLQFVRLV